MAFNESPRDSDRLNDGLVFERRGCFHWMPYFGRGGGDRSSICFYRIRQAEEESSGGDRDPWWLRGWKKVREWSEIVAGPRWKTFLRRFHRSKIQSGGNCFSFRRPEMRTGKFRYDELSYSLNFDGGRGHNSNFDEDCDADDEDFVGRRDFSSRYAAVPPAAKSSMDLASSFT